MRFIVILLLYLSFFPNQGWAQLNISSWVNPGPLSSPHAGLEGITNCTQCHSTTQGLPNEKCLACHTEIKERLDARLGYHARNVGQCVQCHGEHKGRNYDVTGLTRLQFSHTDTGWPLTGAHQNLDCDNCHKQNRKGTNRRTYLGNDSRCITCHENIHGSKKPEFQTCQNCHGTRDWTPRDRLNFDHTKDTKFALTGSHQNVKCFDCHKTKKWAPLKFQECSDCHADPHKGSFGPKCADCHNTTTWGQTSVKVQTPAVRAPTPKTGAKAGAKATTAPSGFDHDKTKFPLRGKHIQVSCKKCHGNTLGKMPKVNFTDCKGCHNDIHKGQFEKLWKPKPCKSCHQFTGFKNLAFDHNKDARYELLGQHTKVPCVKCHQKGKYRWLSATPDCDECHADPHKGEFKPQKCASCHNFDGFKRKDFDHSKTRFPLVGKHKAVTCNDCHGGGVFKGLSTACKDCHNDYHQGQLGIECERCHSPAIGFNDIDFDHNRGSRFRIDGKHVGNACNQCHWGGQYKFENLNCSTCHFDVHNGAHGKECDRCHTTGGFDMKDGFHEFGEYRLEGVHNQLECKTCHDPKKPVRAHPMQCSSCHADPHMGSLSNSCYECHGQISWTPTTFQHNLTGFDLTGAHRFLDCNNCHFNRVFGGLPNECVFCHFKDFNPALPQHVGAPPTCENCHFTFGFRPTK